MNDIVVKYWSTACLIRLEVLQLGETNLLFAHYGSVSIKETMSIPRYMRGFAKIWGLEQRSEQKSEQRRGSCNTKLCALGFISISSTSLVSMK